jgi:AraC family transcriptional regulator, exoenzyme S synthesis regulatory protein ExsA
MDIINLPQDIFPNTILESLVFHNYEASVDALKGKSVLHQNAISLVISGEKTMHFTNKTLNIRDDEFHFLSAGSCLASMKLSDKKAFRSILIFFDNKILSDFYIKYEAQIAAIKKDYAPTKESYVAFKKDAFVCGFIDSLKILFRSNRSISIAMKLLKFEELLLHLLEQYPQQFLSFHVSESSKQMDDIAIKKAVETHILNPITVEELAFLCNMSLSTFKRRFADIYGISPNKWILGERMKIAKDLLIHQNEKPSEIYHKLGYENHSSFTKLFKQTYGLTPKDFQMQELDVYP